MTLAVVRPTIVLAVTTPPNDAEMTPFTSIAIPEPANVGNNSITFALTRAFV